MKKFIGIFVLLMLFVTGCGKYGEKEIQGVQSGAWS